MTAESREAMSVTMRWVIVAAFLVAYVFSFIDRLIIGLMVEPLKRDLLLTDTEISLLQGLAFAAFYTLVGLPIGRIVDRHSRIAIAASGVAIWSAMTALCGLAQNYTQLFMARVGVGVGEATLSPAAYSLFADLFERRQLGLALGIYNMGSAAGGGLAMIVGGLVVQFASGQSVVDVPLLGELRSWQLTFIYVGLPGLLVAVWIWLLPEPTRRSSDGRAAQAGAVPAAIPIREVLAFARQRRRSIAGHHLGVAFSNLSAFAIVSWMPVMLMRAYGWTIAEAGLATGIALIIGGLLGLMGGGWLSDKRYLLEGTAGRIRLCMIVSVLGVPAALFLGHVDEAIVALALFTVIYICSIGPISPAVAALQEMVPAELRGQMSAFYLFVVNIIGITLGSTAVALLSDNIFTSPDGIRYSLSVVSPIALVIAAFFYAWSMSSIRRDTARAEAP